jgi:hypothetical protein
MAQLVRDDGQCTDRATVGNALRKVKRIIPWVVGVGQLPTDDIDAQVQASAA